MFPLIIPLPVDAFSFQKVSSLRHPRPIHNVIPGDFTHDGKLDVLIMSSNRASSDRLDMTLYTGNRDGTFGESYLALAGRSTTIVICSIRPYFSPVFDALRTYTS